jgi:hypothetical protein
MEEYPLILKLWPILVGSWPRVCSMIPTLSHLRMGPIFSSTKLAYLGLLIMVENLENQ